MLSIEPKASCFKLNKLLASSMISQHKCTVSLSACFRELRKSLCSGYGIWLTETLIHIKWQSGFSQPSEICVPL